MTDQTVPDDSNPANENEVKFSAIFMGETLFFFSFKLTSEQAEDEQIPINPDEELIDYPSDGFNDQEEEILPAKPKIQPIIAPDMFLRSLKTKFDSFGWKLIFQATGCLWKSRGLSGILSNKYDERRINSHLRWELPSSISLHLSRSKTSSFKSIEWMWNTRKSPLNSSFAAQLFLH